MDLERRSNFKQQVFEVSYLAQMFSANFHRISEHILHFQENLISQILHMQAARDLVLHLKLNKPLMEPKLQGVVATCIEVPMDT